MSQKAKKKIDWTELGYFLATVVDLYTVIRNTFTKLGVGIGIIPWLVSEGKEVFVKEFLEPLGERFLKAQRVESTQSWREQNGVIYFSVTSDGTIGQEWINRLESTGFRVGDYAKSVLRSKDFTPTSGVTTEIAVLKGMLFENRARITSKIRAEAERRELLKPNAEVACLIREKFTDKDIEAMGLTWIIAMHDPVEDLDRSLRLLGVFRHDDGPWLRAYFVLTDGDWNRGTGFAFAVSQVSAEV